MLEVIILFVVGLIWIVFASIQDIRTREVANWLNFSLIIFASGFRFFYSLFSDSYDFFYQGVIGLIIFFFVGNLLYYSRMFAGGDAKLMVALGPILPYSTVFMDNLKAYILFVFFFLFSGAVYGLVMTLVISFRDFKNFKKEYLAALKNNKTWPLVIMLFGIIIMLLGFIEEVLFTLGVILFIFPYFYLYAKTVDNTCMVRKVKTKNLTEGDWLYKAIKVGRRIIKPTWGGLDKKDIRDLKKKFKTVLIKQGIAFVPVFLIAYLIYLVFWKLGLWNAFW